MIKTKHFNFNRNIQKFAHLIIDAEVDRVVSCIAFIRYIDDAGRGSAYVSVAGQTDDRVAQ